MRSDPSSVLREYALEPLRGELRRAGARVLVARGGRAAAELSATRTRFDAAWVELDGFGGCDPETLARSIARVLLPGAPIVCVAPGAAPLLRSLRLAFRDEGDAAEWRERRRAASAWLSALAPLVEWRRRRALGAILPQGPDWARAHPLGFGLLAAAEHVLGGRPPLRSLGEWSLLEGVRR